MAALAVAAIIKPPPTTAGVMLAAGAVRGVEPDRPRPQTGQAPRPCPASTFSATAICCSLVARWADGAY
ncbi:Uncharacterised protein [Mycobacteroides abscessus subsp. abscessus]|nr:Uncharacterised protein [Mycobacteroides abscessus subsp. abscessus]